MALEVYDNTVVQTHVQAMHFQTTLAAVSIRDYNKDFGLSDSVAALDIDAWEASLSGDNDKTMDAAIGVADYVNNKISSRRLLLVELRMNYSGQGQNSKTSDMKNKNMHTRNMLVGSALDDRTFFIFSKEVAPIVKRRIFSESKVDKNLLHWKILSPEEFVNLFHFVEDLPYMPLSPIEQIRDDGRLYVGKSEFENAIQLINHWLSKALSYKYKYMVEECKALAEVIQDVMEVLSAHEAEIADKETELDYLIAKEELENLKRTFK